MNSAATCVFVPNKARCKPNDDRISRPYGTAPERFGVAFSGLIPESGRYLPNLQAETFGDAVRRDELKVRAIGGYQTRPVGEGCESNQHIKMKIPQLFRCEASISPHLP